MTQIKEKTRVTLADIAQRVGVSKIAVSKVLLGTGGKNVRVSRETARKIRKVANQLHYRPNLFARSLKTNRTKSWGLTFPGMETEYLTSLVSKVYKIAYKKGYHILLDPGMPYKAQEGIDNLISRMVEGLFIFWPYEEIDLTENIILPPIVAIDTIVRVLPMTPIGIVQVDRSIGIYQATKHLITTGRRRIALEVPFPKHRVVEEKIEGWKRAYIDSGFPEPPDSWIIPYYDPQEWDFERGQELASLARERVEGLDGVVTSEDATAIGMMKYFIDRGYRIPEDIAITGFHNTHLAEVAPVELASVGFPLDKIANSASEMMMNLTNQTYVEDKFDTEIPMVNKFPMKFVWRKSAG